MEYSKADYFSGYFDAKKLNFGKVVYELLLVFKV